MRCSTDPVAEGLQLLPFQWRAAPTDPIAHTSLDPLPHTLNRVPANERSEVAHDVPS
jgi:hypothetical protein